MVVGKYLPSMYGVQMGLYYRNQYLVLCETLSQSNLCLSCAVMYSERVYAHIAPMRSAAYRDVFIFYPVVALSRFQLKPCPYNMMELYFDLIFLNS